MGNHLGVYNTASHRQLLTSQTGLTQQQASAPQLWTATIKTKWVWSKSSSASYSHALSPHLHSLAFMAASCHITIPLGRAYQALSEPQASPVYIAMGNFLPSTMSSAPISTILNTSPLFPFSYPSDSSHCLLLWVKRSHFFVTCIPERGGKKKPSQRYNQPTAMVRGSVSDSQCRDHSIRQWLTSSRKSSARDYR